MKTKNQKDLDFFNILRDSRLSAEEKSSYFIKAYYEDAVKKAEGICKKYIPERNRRREQAMDLAGDVLAEVNAMVLGGTLVNRVKSSFTGWLNQYIRNYSKTIHYYIPSSIKKQGESIPYLYYLLHYQDCDLQTAKYEMMDRYRISEEEFKSLYKRLLEAEKKTSANPDAHKEIKTASLDHRKEQMPEWEVPDPDNPHRLFIKKEINHALFRALGSLSPAERDFFLKITEYDACLKELGKRLGMKNPYYEMKKIKKKLIEYLEETEVRDLCREYWDDRKKYGE